MIEIWKDIPGYEGKYQASTYGRIRSLDMKVWNGKGYYNQKGRILKCASLPKGYLICNLSKNNKSESKRIHILVAKTFIDNPKNKPEVNHEDGNKQNNRVENLSWVTHKENMIHASNNKLFRNMKGEKNHNSILIEKDVRDMRRLSKFLSRKELSIIFNSSISNVDNIIYKQTWKYL